jgi:hypothetical protein
LLLHLNLAGGGVHQSSHRHAVYGTRLAQSIANDL